MMAIESVGRKALYVIPAKGRKAMLLHRRIWCDRISDWIDVEYKSLKI